MTKWRLTGFLCESTLTDQERRISIIGIMPGRIIMPSFPGALALGAFVRVTPLPPEATPVKLTLTLNSETIFDLDALSVLPPPDANDEFGLDALHVNIGRFVVMVNEPGVLKLSVSVGDAPPELVSALRIGSAGQ